MKRPERRYDRPHKYPYTSDSFPASSTIGNGRSPIIECTGIISRKDDPHVPILPMTPNFLPSGSGSHKKTHTGSERNLKLVETYETNYAQRERRAGPLGTYDVGGSRDCTVQKYQGVYATVNWGDGTTNNNQNALQSDGQQRNARLYRWPEIMPFACDVLRRLESGRPGADGHRSRRLGHYLRRR